MCENKNLTMMQGKGIIKITKLFHFTDRHRNSQETVLQEGQINQRHNVEHNLMQKETKMGKRMLERVSETSVH